MPTQVSNSSFIPASSEATPTALYAERARLPELPPEPSLWESFRIQLRVIGALIIRESLTRYGRHNIGFLWLLVEPMLFTVGVSVLWNAIAHGKASGLSITEFVLTGYSCLLLWRNMPGRCVMALPPNYELLFHRQVKPIDIFISRCALEAGGATLSFCILSFCCYAIGLSRAPYDILKVAEGWLLLIWYSFSVALLVGAVSERTDIVEKVWHIVTYIMIPISGSFFMLQGFPPDMRSMLLWIPTVSCTEMVRGGFFGPTVTVYYDAPYVILFNSIITLIALVQIRIMARSQTLS